MPFGYLQKQKFNLSAGQTGVKLLPQKTFPIDNLGMRTHVNTEILDKEGKQVLLANQEACVLSLESHRPVKITTLSYPKEGFPEAVFTEAFERFPADFTEDELVFEQVVRSCHIDMSKHMNNIEYIKFALSVFTDDFLQSHEIKELEVHYTGESKEGQTLKVYRRDDTECKGKSFVHIREKDRSVFECYFVFA